jgi:3-oxoacyl-(acyl-carrier-protein) synthase
MHDNMSMTRPRVVVTGLGVVSSIGIGWKPFWEAILAGRSGHGTTVTLKFPIG